MDFTIAVRNEMKIHCKLPGDLKLCDIFCFNLCAERFKFETTGMDGENISQSSARKVFLRLCKHDRYNRIEITGHW